MNEMNVTIVNQISRSKTVITGGCLLLIAVLCGCGALFVAVGSSSEPTPAPAAPQTQALEPVIVSGATVVPASTAAPVITEPTVLAEFAGAGDTVTNNFRVSSCQKAAFHWATVSSGGDWTATLIVDLFNADGEKTDLVNQFVLDPPAEGINGVVVHPLIEGEYILSTQSADMPWTLRVECWDKVTPAGAGMSLAGELAVVTHNYELPTCKKSVFVWSVEPDDAGRAILNVSLYKTTKERPNSLIMEHQSDSVITLKGESQNRLSDGLYWLAVEHVSGPWTIRWECRD